MSPGSVVAVAVLVRFRRDFGLPIQECAYQWGVMGGGIRRYVGVRVSDGGVECVYSIEDSN